MFEMGNLIFGITVYLLKKKLSRIEIIAKQSKTLLIFQLFANFQQRGQYLLSDKELIIFKDEGIDLVVFEVDERFQPFDHLISDLFFIALFFFFFNGAVGDEVVLAVVGGVEVDVAEGKKLVEVGQGELDAFG